MQPLVDSFFVNFKQTWWYATGKIDIFIPTISQKNLEKREVLQYDFRRKNYNTEKKV